MAATNILNTLSKTEQEQIYGTRLLGKGQIRLLHLLAKDSGRRRNESMNISCKLTTSALGKVGFVAVSYNWGDLENAVPIQVNGLSYKVTRSVVAILSILVARPARSSMAPAQNPANLIREQPLWIDAISINQQDVPERQAQMSMMKEIYKSASRTMIYLGEPVTGRESAKVVFDWFHSLIQEPFSEFLTTSKEVRLRRWNSQSWALVRPLLEQAWFRRRWTVQEAAVSPEVWVVYGTEIIRWEVFAEAVERCSYLWGDIAQRPGFQLVTNEPTADVSATLAISRLRQSLKKGRKAPSMLELLLKFRRCGCMYSEERIFALLGLCNEEERETNEIVLQVGPMKVFKRYVLSHIKLYRDLNVLCACLEIARFERPKQREIQYGVYVDPDNPAWARMEFLPSMPSWIPNFTSYRVEWQLGPNGDLHLPHFRPVFDASRGCPQSMPNLEAANRTGILSVEGIEVDRISDINPHLPIGDEDRKRREASIWKSLWEWTCLKSTVPQSYASQDERWVAFMRTLGAGSRCWGTDSILSDDYVRYHAMDFFSGTWLEQQWRALNLRANLPHSATEWYIPPKLDADPLYFPGITFEKLCYFRFIRGISGRIGLAPVRTQPGDRIVVLFGCSSPLLLAEDINRRGHFRIRGEAYMHGFGFGEAIQLWKMGRLQKQLFHLV